MAGGLKKGVEKKKTEKKGGKPAETQTPTYTLPPELAEKLANLGTGGPATTAADIYGGVIPPTTPVPTARGVMPAQEVYQEIFRLPPETLRAVQESMWVAGFYPRGADITDIRLGTVDELTLAAWQALVTHTARYYVADPTITLDQVLSRLAAQGPPPQGGGAGQSVTRTIDVNTIASATDEMAQRVLGRRATREEKRLVVAAIRAIPADVQLSVPAVAEQTLRTNAPTEATGYDMVRVYNDFLRIIGMGGPTNG